MSIDKIIKGCKAKDRKCQQALYQITAIDLMRVAQRYMKNKDEAKDIFQEAYLKIFQKIDQFDPQKGSIGAWAGRIVSNLAIEKLRGKKVFSNIENLPVALHPVSKEDILGRISADELLAVIHDLPESYRIVFLLYIVEGYSHKEISKKLKITESTSRSQLVRARSKLKLLIQKKNKLNPMYYGEVK